MECGDFKILQFVENVFVIRHLKCIHRRTDHFLIVFFIRFINMQNGNKYFIIDSEKRLKWNSLNGANLLSLGVECSICTQNIRSLD